MRRTVLLFAFLMLLQPAFAQFYSAILIPGQLVKGSNAVVRKHLIEYVYTSQVSAVKKVSSAVTVMNEAGEGAAVITVFTDMHSTLKSFSGEILDRAGKSVRKLKKSDLSFTESLDENAVSDMGAWIYYPKTASYPYTVTYEYELVYKDGILSFPTFCPVVGPNIAVEKAEYRLVLPVGTKFHTKALNMEERPIVETRQDAEAHVWKIESFEPIPSCPFMPDNIDMLPIVYAVPHNFTYNEKSGTMDSWDGYSKWQWGLLDGLKVLPEEAKVKTRELTSGASSDREKVEILYDFLGQTRYVSIQNGIMGFQPMSATQVYNNKFGDCKGLSNYMMAMLAECGIESHYVEIGLGGTKLRDDYVHPSQTNHAILYVPLDGQGLWLECTNTQYPIGYVHSDIADRRALVYSEGTAKLVDMPSYPDSLNVSRITAKVAIDPSGKINAGVRTVGEMVEYEYLVSFDKKNATEKLRFVSRDIKLPLVDISNITYRESKTSSPWAEITYDLDGKANVTGNRIYLNVNPFRSNPVVALRRNRSLGINVRYGYRHLDNLSIELPEGYEVEALPAPISVDGVFGHFRLSVIPGDGKIIVSRDLYMKKGLHSVEHYDVFREFMKAISAGNDSQIVLVKK